MRKKLTRVSAMARKEVLHILRDPRSLGMAIAIPMLLLLLFGSALSLDVDRVPMVVWDRSETEASRGFVSHFAGSRYFAIQDYIRDYRELERSIDEGRAMLALVIPRDFAGRIASGRRVSVQLIADGSDSNTATLATGYAEAVALDYSRAVAIRRTRHDTGAVVRPPFELRPRAWFNADMESRNYIVPGLIAVIMMVIAALLTSLTVAREWERGSMEQLISTPVRASEIVVGKLLPYFAIGLLDVALSVVLGQVLFQVPLRGSVVLVFGMASLFLVGVLGQGMVISIVTRNQYVASQTAMLTALLPSFLLSGFAFSIASMPAVVRSVTYLIPARYLVTALKGIYLKGVGLEVLGLEAALLAVFAGVTTTLAVVLFKKRLD